LITPRESVVQLAYLVRPGGLNDAIDYWLNQIGAGPFFTGDFRLEQQTHRGRPTNAGVRVALAYHGDMQIELIEPLDDAPSPYKEWLDKYPSLPRAGLYHHVMMDHVDFDKTYNRYLASGCKEGFLGRSSAGTRVAYLDAADTIGGFIELVEPNPGWTAMCAEMREISRTWDGSNPRRGLETLGSQLGPTGN
jgi:hypothetical protein